MDSAAERGTAKTESQQLLAFGTVLHKTKTNDIEIQGFREKLDKDRADLTALLRQRVQQAEATEQHHRRHLAAQISKALQCPPEKSRKRQSAGGASLPPLPSAVTLPSHVKLATQRIQDARGLMKAYESASSRINSTSPIDDQVAEDWGKHIERKVRQLHNGTEVSTRLFRKRVGLDADHEEADVFSGMQKEERENLLRNYPMAIDHQPPELAITLRYLERGVKRIVKGLPRDESL